MNWHDILPPEQRALLAKFTWVERALELCEERDAIAERVKELEAQIAEGLGYKPEALIEAAQSNTILLKRIEELEKHTAHVEVELDATRGKLTVVRAVADKQITRLAPWAPARIGDAVRAAWEAAK